MLEGGFRCSRCTGPGASVSVPSGNYAELILDVRRRRLNEFGFGNP